MRRFKTYKKSDSGLFVHTARATNKMNVLKTVPRGGIRMWGYYVAW